MSNDSAFRKIRSAIFSSDSDLRGAGVYGYPTYREGHRCGKCANPFTGGNPDCVNAREEKTTEGMRDGSDRA